MSRTAATKARTAIVDNPVEAARPQESYRETVESIVVAFILALLIRGFEAEAFVIPTGSMAPTLMGRHKQVVCPQCGHEFTVNASEESDPRFLHPEQSGWIEFGTCVNCRFRARIEEEPAFKGDRILVMKFPYDLPGLPGARSPERWDVVVFKYPEEPETNYIKRLVGLPEEELRIDRGDVYVRPLGHDGPFRIARKPLRHQDAMQILVHDDAHRPKALAGDPRWRRWASAAEGAWAEGPEGTYVAKTEGDGWADLRYRHLVPSDAQWQAVLRGEPLPADPKPVLVTDFYSYNTGVALNVKNGMMDLDGEGYWMQPHWVGDLSVSFRLEVPAASGQFRVELVEAGVSNRCEIDLATGRATLYHGDEPLGPPEATPITGPGTYDLIFANVDDRLSLRVNGSAPFGHGLIYDDGPDAGRVPTAADLSPVGLGARGAAVQVSGLVLTRDIYYTQEPGQVYDYPGFAIKRRPYDEGFASEGELFAFLSDPSRFAELGRARSVADYPIGAGRYMMLGDNSPRSRDGRKWTLKDRLWDPSGRESWEVPASLLIGKAFYIYWPHGRPFGPSFRVVGDLRFPFRPYVERMKWIR